MSSAGRLANTAEGAIVANFHQQLVSSCRRVLSKVNKVVMDDWSLLRGAHTISSESFGMEVIASGSVCRLWSDSLSFVSWWLFDIYFVANKRLTEIDSWKARPNILVVLTREHVARMCH